jgi:hypothetical protein
MTKKINYEDDIFTLSLMVRSLSDMLKLEIDPEFFLRRIESDIAFLDSAIGRVYQILTTGPFFVKRHEYLQSMQRLKRSFVELLSAVIDRRFPFAEHMTGSVEAFRRMSETHTADLSSINASLSQTKGQEEEHIVSEDEFKNLLSPMEEGQG